MKKLSFIKNFYLSTIKFLVLGGISCGGVALTALPSLGAENLRFNYGIFSFSLSIDALELYASKGEINSELNFYTKRLDEKKVKQLRHILRRQIKINPILLYRLTRSPIGIDIIESVGKMATTHYGHNGFYAIRGSVTNAAMEYQDRGITLIDVMRKFPGQDIQVDISKLMDLQNELTTLVEYREAIRELIVREAIEEASIGISNNFTPQKDLRTLGETAFTKQTINIGPRTADRNSSIGSQKPFRVRLYLPQGLSKPAPLVVLSHGFGSEPESFDYLGEHLASYGIAAVSVEHIGSDSDYELEILEGAKRQAISPQEFIDRPLDIRHVIDELERRNKFDLMLKGTLDLERIGAIGHSLGGYTALTLAGAKINTNRLRQQCPDKKINLNMSLLMQCLAKDLTPKQELADPRIKAAIAISPIASKIHGPESLSNISIPTAIISGSEDIVAPVVQEQIYPFTWLSAKDKYLAMMIPGDHFSTTYTPHNRSSESTVIEKLVGGRRSNSSRPNVKAFAVAFIKAYIEQDPEYLSYLTASYAQDISSSEINFKIIRSLDLESLEQEYSDTLDLLPF